MGLGLSGSPQLWEGPWEPGGLLGGSQSQTSTLGQVRGEGTLPVTCSPRSCPDVPWYLTSGDRCQTNVSKLGLGLGVGLGLGLTLLVLLILCIVLTTCLAKGKKKSAGGR